MLEVTGVRSSSHYDLPRLKLDIRMDGALNHVGHPSSNKVQSILVDDQLRIGDERITRKGSPEPHSRKPRHSRDTLRMFVY